MRLLLLVVVDLVRLVEASELLGGRLLAGRRVIGRLALPMLLLLLLLLVVVVIRVDGALPAPSRGQRLAGLTGRVGHGLLLLLTGSAELASAGRGRNAGHRRRHRRRGRLLPLAAPNDARIDATCLIPAVQDLRNAAVRDLQHPADLAGPGAALSQLDDLAPLLHGQRPPVDIGAAELIAPALAVPQHLRVRGHGGHLVELLDVVLLLLLVVEMLLLVWLLLVVVVLVLVLVLVVLMLLLRIDHLRLLLLLWLLVDHLLVSELVVVVQVRVVAGQKGCRLPGVRRRLHFKLQDAS